MKRMNCCRTTIYLYKIENGECGECKLNRIFVKYAKSLGNLKEGNCFSVGYTVPSGNELITVPVIGQIIVSKFKKKIIG